MTRIALAQQRVLELAGLVVASWRNASGQYSVGLSVNLRALEHAHRELLEATLELVGAPGIGATGSQDAPLPVGGTRRKKQRRVPPPI